MIPAMGSECDLCVPDHHYLLKCACGHEWDEPPTLGKFWCPTCSKQVEVTHEEDERWQSEVLGILKV